MSRINSNRFVKPKIINLWGDRKKINVMKKAGFELFKPVLEYTKWGPKYGCLSVKIYSKDKYDLFKKLNRSVSVDKKKDKKSVLSSKDRWVKRLSKLSGVSLGEAKRIADLKEDYKDSQISDLEDKQAVHYSSERAKLINEIKRSNPLRYIRDSGHANNIIRANVRHEKSDYESRLDEGRELARMGEIDRSEVRDYARRNL